MDSARLAYGIVASKTPATRREVRFALGAIIAYCAAMLAILPAARVVGPAVPQTVTVFTTGIIIAELATAFLLINQADLERQLSKLLLACAYFYSAILGTAHLLTFPGALVANGPALGGLQITGYIFNAWKLGFVVLVLAAMLARRYEDDAGALDRSALGLSLGALLVAVVAALWLGMANEARLPALVVNGVFMIADMVPGLIAVLLGLTAITVIWTTRGPIDLMTLWMTMVLAAFCGDLMISTMGGARFTVGWYAGRTSGLISGCMIFMLFVVRFATLQRISMESARKLRERTMRLQLEIARRSEAEERLVQSQKVEAMGQLTGGIAHDFNNLLAAIVGNLDLLLRRRAWDQRSERYVEQALNAAERGRKLTSQLLVFSRTQRLQLNAIFIADVLADMQELLAHTLGPQIKIVFKDNGVRAAVLSEMTQLELAVLNVAINARDAMPDGGVLTIALSEVEINDDAELAAGNYVRLSITDTGSGMSSEVAARAFEPFYTTKAIGQGTGLGLSQVFGIARRASGTARIESRLGQGTTVHLFLRQSADEPVALGDREQTTAIRAELSRVLVVDDDPDVRRFLSDLMIEHGFAVEEAVDGAAALASLARSRPDLLVVDYAMPGLNGAEIATKARARYPGLPIVFVTGFADTAVIEATFGSDARLVRKPFRTHELQAAISIAIQSSEAAGENAAGS